jgi:hypothetical protein
VEFDTKGSGNRHLFGCYLKGAGQQRPPQPGSDAWGQIPTVRRAWQQHHTGMFHQWCELT